MDHELTPAYVGHPISKWDITASPYVRAALSLFMMLAAFTCSVH